MGALPFIFSGSIPNVIDAVFETVSGFTTTGASILPEVESLSHCILFWRSFTHWIGGMGVLVFLLSLLPLTGGGYHMNLMKAESPGPSVSKLVPKSTVYCQNPVRHLPGTDSFGDCVPALRRHACVRRPDHIIWNCRYRWIWY